MNTGLAHIEGPATKEQVAQVEVWRDRQKDFQEELKWIRKDLKRARKPERIAVLEEEKRQVERVLEIIGGLLDRIEWKQRDDVLGWPLE